MWLQYVDTNSLQAAFLSLFWPNAQGILLLLLARNSACLSKFMLPPTRHYLCVRCDSRDRVVKQTEQEFLQIATHTHRLAVVVVHPLSFLSYLTDKQKQVCLMPPAQFCTMTCVCFTIPRKTSGQQVLRRTAMCVCKCRSTWVT